MLANIVFGIFCAVVIHPILLPGRRVHVTAVSFTCPDGSDYEQETETPLEKKIFSLARSAKRLEPLTASGDVFIRIDPESLFCYERDEVISLEAYVTLVRSPDIAEDLLVPKKFCLYWCSTLETFYAKKYLNKLLKQILTEWWNDKLICWEPADFDNVNNVTIKVGDLWMPKLISFTKFIQVWNLEYYMSDCTVYSNGTVTCLYMIFLTGACNMRLRYWPIASEADCWISLETFNPTGRQKLFHRDNRTSKEWLATASVGNYGQFVATHVARETEGNGIVYRFRFQANTVAFGHSLMTIAGVLSLILIISFGLPAGSVARVSLLGCVCVSLILTIGFLGGQLSSVTPDTPDIVRLHGGMLIIVAVALLPATLLAPRLTPTKPYIWQLSLRSWLLSSAIGQFLLRIFRISSPADKGITAVGGDGQQSSSFQKEDSETCSSGEFSTRLLLFTLFDRVLAVVCGLAVLSLWIAMYFL